MTPRRHAQAWALLAALLPAGCAVRLPVRNHPAGPPARERADETGREDEPRDDQPDAAAAFRRLQMRDEKGEIPLGGLRRAAEHVAAMKAARAAAFGLDGGGKDPGVAGLDPSSWNWLGPGNVGGRIRSVVIDPTDASRIWVGSVGGGIWFSSDAGGSWHPVDDFMANLAVSTMVMDPSDPAILYAGTGEGAFGLPTDGYTADGLQGGGIFKSTDGGVTWDVLGGTDPSAAPAMGCGLGAVPCPTFWLGINRLAIAPDTGKILAATVRGVADSTDGGATWTQRTTSKALDVDFRPGDGTRAVVGELGVARYSTDGGQTWSAANFNPPIVLGTTGNGRVELAYAANNSFQVVYAAVNNNDGDLYFSNDGGQNFTRVNTGTQFFLGASNQGWYDNIVWVNPFDSNFVVVGGIDLWRSTDGGVNLSKISDWRCGPLRGGACGGKSAHADQHVIVADPGFDNAGNRRVYFANDGGLFRTDDVATVGQQSGWVDLNHALGVTQFYGGAASGATVIGGAQDNNTLRYTGDPETWSNTQSGDGGYCAADPTDPSTFYGEYVNLQLFRSTDGAASASYIYCNPVPPSGPPCTGAGITDTASANFIAPFVLDPEDSNTLLAGSAQLWRSSDVKSATPTWSVLKAPALDGSGNPVPISAIAVSSLSSDLIVVGHNDGRIFLTFDGGTTGSLPIWTDISAGLPSRFVTRLVFDDSRVPVWIYATFGGFSGDNVYVTKDFGSTWTDVSGSTGQPTDLPAVPVRVLAIDPANHDFLYVGTEVGIFASEDAGATWQVPQGGPANVSVDDLFWYNGDLVAATHGRGMFSTHTPVFAAPLCVAPDANCPCAGYWDCGCTWPAQHPPTSTEDAVITCAVTVRTGAASARNLRVNGRLTLLNPTSGASIGVNGAVVNYGAIVADAGTPGYLSCGTLVNVRPPHVVGTNGVIALNGAISASGDISDGGYITATSLNGNNLTVAASDGSLGSDASVSTTGAVTVRGDLLNNGTIAAGGGITVSNGTTGATHVLRGSGEWQTPSLVIGQYAAPDVAILGEDMSLAIPSITVSNMTTLDLAGHDLTVTGTSFDSQGTAILGAKTLTLGGMTSMSFAKALGAGIVVLDPGGTSTFGAGNGAAGSFQPSIQVKSGTVVDSAGGVLDGAVTVDAGATLKTSTVTLNGDLVVNGALSKNVGSTTLYFNGSTLIDNGSILADFVTFVDHLNPTNHHAQAMGGSGSWLPGSNFQLSNGAVTTLLSNVTVPHGYLSIGSGSTLDLQSHRFTYTGNQMSFGGQIVGAGSFVVSPASGSATASGGGANEIASEMHFASGTTTVTSGTVAASGPVFVDSGATLGESGYGGFAPTGDMTVNGTVNCNGGTMYYLGNGTFTNNGSVVSTYFNLGKGYGGPLAQRLAGAGTWSGTNSRLYVGAESSVTLGSDVTYGGPLLYLDGRIDAGSFIFSLPCTTMWQGAGEVTGSLRRTDLAACSGPISYGSPYTTIQFTSGTPPTDVTVDLREGPPGSIPGAVARSYTIEATPPSGFAATLRLHYLDSELNGNNESTLELYRNDGSNWSPQGASARDTVNNWVEYNGVTQFSPWTLGSPPAPFSTYNTRVSFEAALGAAATTTVTFEGIAPSGSYYTVPHASSLNLDGVQFASPDGNVLVVDPGYGPPYDLGSGASLSPQDVANANAPATVTITPPANAHAAGFEFRTFNTPAQLDVLVTTSAGSQHVTVGQLSGSVQFVGFTSPNVIESLQVKALAGQYVALDNVTVAASEGGCTPPAGEIVVADARAVVDTGQLVLDFQDPNPPGTVTGYDVYRTTDASAPPVLWTELGTDIADEDPGTPGIQWTDASGDTPPPGRVFYYKVAAYDSLCSLQGPL